MWSILAEGILVVVSVVLFVPKLVIRAVHEALYKYYPEAIGHRPTYVQLESLSISKTCLCLNTKKYFLG
jgi:hypothetical protein